MMINEICDLVHPSLSAKSTQHIQCFAFIFSVIIIFRFPFSNASYFRRKMRIILWYLPIKLVKIPNYSENSEKVFGYLQEKILLKKKHLLIFFVQLKNCQQLYWRKWAPTCGGTRNLIKICLRQYVSMDLARVGLLLKMPPALK